MTIEEKATAYAENFPPVPSDDITYAIGCAYIAGATEAIASQWVSVEEKEPQENGDYLICTEYGEIEIAFWEDNYWLGNDSYPVRCVTHWRELPELPTKGGEK